MDEKSRSQSRLVRLRNWLHFGGFVLGLLLWLGGVCAAADFVEDFEDVSSGETSWYWQFDKQKCRLIDHRRVDQAHKGQGAEFLNFEAADEGTLVELRHSLPATQVLLGETHLSVWVRCQQPGCQLSLRLVLPNEIDPTTGKTALMIPLEGDTYTDEEGRWQQLTCRTTKRAVLKTIGWARNYYEKTEIDTEGMYVDRAYLTAKSLAGPVKFLIDDMRLGPRVRPPTIIPVDHREDASATATPAKFHLDQLTIEGKPTFLRILPYHNEDPAELARLRFNTAWIPDFANVAVLKKLRAQGLWMIAIPPQAIGPDGEMYDARTANLAPFSKDTEGILAWYLGTGIPAADKSLITNWIETLRGADRKYNRPFMGDVAGLELSYSRLFKMLGVSRNVLHTDLNFREYREALMAKRHAARPGSFCWTWIETEPAPELDGWRVAAGWHPVVVEPEQIRLQLYAALQAGNRGIGFMKSSDLNEERPGGLERKLVVQLLNMELDLIEPWLATATLRSTVPVKISQRKQQLRQGNLFGGSAEARRRKDELLRARTDDLRQKPRLKKELEAAVLETVDGNLLILPAWLEEGAQFVPGRLGGENVRMTVPGVSATAVAFEITTTGVHSLDGRTRRVAGGLEITLQKFDQTAMVLLTSNPRLKMELDRKVYAMAPESAAISLRLAETKLERVRAIDRELVELGYPQGDGLGNIRKCESSLRSAREALRLKDFNGARILSGEAMQALRILQRGHWNDAVRNLSSPTSSLHTLCFQTLPDHWDMMARFGSKISVGDNLLRSGDFEDLDTMIAEGWQHKQRESSGIQANAELAPRPSPGGGQYSLRLAALPLDAERIPLLVPEPPVTVTTPPLTVQSGQLIHIRGQIRIRRDITGSADGVMFYDSLAGPAQGLRWKSTNGWQRFEMFREATHSGSMTLTLSLTGMGDVLIDQLQVIAVTPSRSIGGFRGEKHYDPRHILTVPVNRRRVQGMAKPQGREGMNQRYDSRRNNARQR
ncbi:hypothetical protein Pan258_39430 [Symmachiella dynata]|nr:hypothetical protein Pan258_39430 [Symmachiella dynata]